MTEWLTLAELATYLKRGKSTLYRMAQHGEIPARKMGRPWRFDREEIDRWLRRQTAPRPTQKLNRRSRRRPKRRS